MGKRKLAGDVHRCFDVPRACVQAELVNGTLVVKHGSGVQLVHAGVEFGRLADGVKVADGEGNELVAHGAYYVTLDTIDPYHLLTDA